MKPKIIKAHMQVAETYAKLSTARRLQVGAIIVKDDRIISIGYNGMPSGWDNNCEDTETTFDERDTYNSTDWKFDESKKQYYRLKTKPEVLHAEANAIAKVARSPESAEDAVIFITHAPCIECAKLVFQSGIRQVFYRDNYRSDAGTNFLKQAGVTVNKLDV
jgi:dCMP deaminase